MKINKGVVSLAVVVAGIAGVSQISAVSAKQDAGNNVSEHRSISGASVAISQARATEIAQGLLAGTVKQIHLDRGDHGKAVWKVRILSTDGTQRGDFRINATTGDVLKSSINPIGSGHANEAMKTADKLEKEKLHTANKLEKEKLHIAEKAHKAEVEKQHLEKKGQLSQ